MKQALSLYDVVRIDHFRGFDEYYSIPAEAETAEYGAWEKGPGVKLFEVMKNDIPNLNVIAEDLGMITDSVREMVKESGFPNMKVLQFAFDVRKRKKGVEPNEHLPFTYGKNCVVYTGTHDNQTLLGAMKSIPIRQKMVVAEYLGMNPGTGAKKLAKGVIRAAMASTADLCIIPLQDYLGIDDEGRINTPSTHGINWRWRVTGDKLTRKARKEMKQLTKTYWR